MAEVEILSGVSIKNKTDMEHAANTLHKLGVKSIYISMGADGTYASSIIEDNQTMAHFPAHKGKIINVTGAGDSYMAGLLYSHINNYNLTDTVAFAQSMAFMTAQYPETICPHITVDAIKQLSQ